MRYRSKPHTIEAFQFTKENIKSPDLPDWFDEAIRNNVVQITMNGTDNYVSLYSKIDGGVRKAHLNDWICKSASGVLFPMPEAEFEADFELDQ